MPSSARAHKVENFSSAMLTSRAEDVETDILKHFLQLVPNAWSPILSKRFLYILAPYERAVMGNIPYYYTSEGAVRAPSSESISMRFRGFLEKSLLSKYIYFLEHQPVYFFTSISS
jgi:hypothetical protein